MKNRHMSSFISPLRRKIPHKKRSFPLHPRSFSPTSSSCLSLRALSPRPLYSTHGTIVAASAVPKTHVIGMVHLFVSFLAGGIFFTALFAGFTAFVAVGGSNIAKLVSIAKSVIARVWSVFLFGLNETRLALRMDGKWQWREAWTVLQEKMVETRQAAAEGMNAIMAEKNFYAGAVGQPGLITAQYFLNRLLPFSLSTQMENALKNSLKGVKNNYIKKVTLQEFTAGGVPPELLEARNYELGKDALAFDVDVKWESQAKAKLQVATRRLGFQVPVKVLNPTFEGTARVVMTPLTAEPPGWGAILLSMPSVPNISLDVKAAGGDMTKIPWLKREIVNGLQQQIEENFLWPKRIVLPSLAVPPTARTVIPKTELDELATTDPLLQKENMLAQNAALKDHVDNLKPDVASIPTNLKVNVGENTTDVNGDDDDDVVAPPADHHGGSTRGAHDWFDLMPHYKNSTKVSMDTV